MRGISRGTVAWICSKKPIAHASQWLPEHKDKYNTETGERLA